MKNKWSYFLGGLSFGLSLGFLAGLLEAPDTGERTRQKLARKAGRLKNSVSSQAKHSHKN